MDDLLIKRYNVPVPRYTSYPPANYFDRAFSSADYVRSIAESNTKSNNISFYIHVPFCRHLCHYCGCNSYAMGSQEAVEAYMEALMCELRQMVGMLDGGRKLSQIHYGGGSPTSIPVGYLKSINDFILGAFEATENAEIAIECHPGYMDAEYIESLLECGFNRFSLGVQDFREDVLKAVNRKVSLLAMEDVVRLLRGRGASINLDFIYGLPLQSAESFADTIARAVELKPDRVVTFSYAHVPWVNPRQLALEKVGLPLANEKQRMYDLAKEVLLSAGYCAVGMDHFVLPTDELNLAQSQRALHRNFQGYCTRSTTAEVYALGATAISQLQGAYSQNTKDLKRYVELASSGCFATERGYNLSPEQQITREVITSLMCNNCVEWAVVASKFGCTVEEVKQSTTYNPKTIAQFVEDGICIESGHRLEVTPSGLMFIRNVAASLDKLMINSEKSFSKPL